MERQNRYLQLFPIHLLSNDVMNYVRENEYYSNRLDSLIKKFVIEMEQAINNPESHREIMENSEKKVLDFSKLIERHIGSNKKQLRPEHIREIRNDIEIPDGFPIGEVAINYDVLVENPILKTGLIRIINQYNNDVRNNNEDARKNAIHGLEQMARTSRNLQHGKIKSLKSAIHSFSEKGIVFPPGFPEFKMENIDVIINEPRYLGRLHKIIDDFNGDMGIKDKKTIKKETLAKIKTLKTTAYKNEQNNKKRGLEEFARYWEEDENNKPGKKRKINKEDDLSDFAEYWGNDVDVSNQPNDVNVDFDNVLNYKASEGGKKTKRKRSRKVKTIKQKKRT